MVVSVKRVSGPSKNILENALTVLKGKEAKVGWLTTQKYPDEKTPDRKLKNGTIKPGVIKVGPPISQVAIQNEYGTSIIPARPFMRPAITKNKLSWREIVRRGLNALFKGKTTLYNVMDLVGSKAVFDIQKEIKNIWSPPLSERTVKARKKSLSRNKKGGKIDKPLIFTGILFGAINHSVEDSK